MFKNLKKSTYMVILVLILVIFLLGLGTNFIADFFWFKSLGFKETFVTILLSSIGIKLFVFLFFFLFIFINLFFTLKFIKNTLNAKVDYHDVDFIPIKQYILSKFITPKKMVFVFLGVSIVTAFFFTPIASNKWQVFQMYLNTVDFNILDPIFNKDISFYIFKIPFYEFIYSLLLISTLVSIFLVSVVYALFTPSTNFKFYIYKKPQIHLKILFFIFFVLMAVSYKLNSFNLLLSEKGVAFGANYTDIHARLPANNILAILSLVIAVILIVSIFVNLRKIVLGSVLLMVISSILLGNLFPLFLEKFKVEPNQYTKEKEYIEYNIEFTKFAYNLDEITQKDFTPKKDLPPENLQNNKETLNNIRLWDWTPIKQTYNQLQGLRPVYQFNSVDIDRYVIDGKYRQVMLSARELDQDSLSEGAKTWQNTRLLYTHGYGLVMSPVNSVTPQGLPDFFIKNIPPKAEFDLKVERPEIYFGELTKNYVIVNTKTKEFDYPAGDDNVYNHYEGKGGVQLDSFFKRLVFAYKYKDLRILLSDSIKNDSRILFDRDVKTIVNKIAPFLRYDNDPYLVLSEGKLYWIIDGYTATDRYPYSEVTKGWGNYIRNSVKVVIDAYEGSVDYYVSDFSDPIISSYSKIFPEMFKTLDEMPSDLKGHIRYPVDLFKIQAEIFTLYHMENTQVFYNKEDAWSIPEEIYGTEIKKVAPYYTIMQIPGESESEFILMQPFTPAKKRNMVAWMAARCDGDNYGKLILFKFPKDSHIYGPAQIEARIDQDSEISQQLTLWNQRGSKVIRGNLLVIPVDNSLLYVEPIFIQAEESNLPELSRVIVCFGEKVVMEKTFEIALEKIFGYQKTSQAEENTSDDSLTKVEDLDLKGLIDEANKAFFAAQEKLKTGDWAGYGENLNRLQDALEKLKKYQD